MELKSVLDIIVSPRSSRKRIVLTDSGSVRASLSAPPVDGRANAELLALVSKRLKIPKSAMTIVSGEKSRKKRIVIKGISIEDVFEILGRP